MNLKKKNRNHNPMSSIDLTRNIINSETKWSVRWSVKGSLCPTDQNLYCNFNLKL